MKWEAGGLGQTENLPLFCLANQNTSSYIQ